MSKQQVIVPDIGGAEGAEVIELLVAVGDEVSVDQSLIVLESDKASMEIPSTLAGTVVELLVTEGEQLAEGSPVVVVEVATDTAAGDRQGSVGSPPASAASPADQAPPVDETPVTAAPAKAAGDAAVSAADAAPEQTVMVPDIGSDDPVDLIEVIVKVGDSVAEGDSLVVLESDKASMEVPAPAAGEVLEILVKVDDQVRQGDALLVLRVSAANAIVAQPAPTPQPPATAMAPIVPKAAAVEKKEVTTAATGVYAGPAVRKQAREFGIQLDQVSGSGPRGRVVKEDLQLFVQKRLSEKPAAAATVGSGIPAIAEIDFSRFGEVDVTPRAKLDLLTAKNMQRSWLNVPHVTQFDEADITELEEFRSGLKAEAEQRGTRLTPLPFLLKACAVALRDNPKINSSLGRGGADLVYKKYIHIGMAVDTPAGLVVPVIRDVDRKTIWELAQEVSAMAASARDRKLTPADMQGGCFTISSLGNIGGTGFTPIVNAPEVAILGVSKAAIKPVWDGQVFAPRKMLPLALSYDHRVVNGGDGGRFFSRVVTLLGDIRQLAM